MLRSFKGLSIRPEPEKLIVPVCVHFLADSRTFHAFEKWAFTVSVPILGPWLLSWACPVGAANHNLASVGCVWRMLPVGTDAAFHTVEWSSQPLRFESVVLRSPLDQIVMST